MRTYYILDLTMKAVTFETSRKKIGFVEQFEISFFINSIF